MAAADTRGARVKHERQKAGASQIMPPQSLSPNAPNCRKEIPRSLTLHQAPRCPAPLIRRRCLHYPKTYNHASQLGSHTGTTFPHNMQDAHRSNSSCMPASLCQSASIQSATTTSEDHCTKISHLKPKMSDLIQRRRITSLRIAGLPFPHHFEEEKVRQALAFKPRPGDLFVVSQLFANVLRRVTYYMDCAGHR